MHYEKPPLTIEQQVAQLKQRGMIFTDEREAARILARLNYYRLTAYWYPFYSDSHAREFQPGTRFDDVVAHYEFDRRLRLRVMDAVERFEIALRTQFAYQLAHRHNGWAYEDAALFSDLTRHTSRLNTLDRELNRSKETFILHYQQKYTTPQRPPLWIACEVMSLGLLSGLFDNLKQRADRKAIAHDFGLDELVLRSLTHHVTFIRNICAHHGRLWNRDFAITTKLPEHAPKNLRDSLEPESPKKLYNTLVLLGYCLEQISDDGRWRNQIIELIGQYPQIDTSAMGFPLDWRDRPFWHHQAHSEHHGQRQR